ncbi:UNVERIFIED_ORG: hypothetical protein LHK14_17740 [Roseateles sp. XES5]|nr:hypothetical protein [Roseateles sp. XES5]
MASEISIGGLHRQVVTDCIRKWATGANLTASERTLMDDALALYRLDMLRTLFVDRGGDNAAR